MHGSIDSKPAHSPPPRGIFSLLHPHSGAFAREGHPGVGHCQKQLSSVLRTLKVAYGSATKNANICTIVST